MVTVQDGNERSEAEKWLLRALVVSLLIHVTAFGVWKAGQKYNLLGKLHLPPWMRLVPKSLNTLPKKLNAAQPLKTEPAQLTFVDVDPALAEAAPPKKPKYYSANNSVAANPKPKNAAIPEIRGHQKDVVKTTPNIKLNPKPLQPSPPVKQKEISEARESKPLPKKTEAPGDLAMEKPAEKPQEKPGQATTDVGADVTPEPVHHRPRTIAEAMAEHGMLGDVSGQEGGVNRLKLDSTLDAMKTSYGDYDREFIDAVRTCWYHLLENRTTGSGKVIVEFRMHADGRITDVNMVHNDMSDLLGLICQRAILDPSPYRPWPIEMRRDLPGDTRDVTFTFIYE